MLYSPLQNVQKGIAPAIIFHGTEDTTIPLSQMYEYKKAIANVGGDCEVIEYPGQKHGFFNYRGPGSPYYYKTVGDMLIFLDKHGYLTR
ncbi:MAG: acetyl esterase [Candidatus Pelagisphaera sp.]|jgi:acetyl esterase